MISVHGLGESNGIQVFTKDHGGFTPEELAERALDRIIQVGDQSHPLVRDQAIAFRNHIRGVLVFLILPMVVLFPEQYRMSQRLGLTLAASGSLMMVPILYMGRGVTPFDGWASLMETIGLILFLWSSSLRLFRHHFAQVLQVRSMARELRERHGE